MISKKNRFLYSGLIVFLIYNFIFPVRLNAIPGFELIFYLVILAHIPLFPKLVISANKLPIFYPVIITSWALLLLGIFSIVINSSDNLNSIIAVVKYVFAIVSGYLISLILLKRYEDEALDVLLKTIVLSSLLISITCLLEFFIPSAKVFFGTLIATSGNINYLESFRTHGLATGGGASLSVGLAISSVLALFLADKERGGDALFWSLVSVVIFISTLFVGRSGFFLLIFFFMAFFLSQISFRTIIVVTITSVVVVYSVGMLAEEQLSQLYGYGLEPIKNYIEHGELRSKTTTGLLEMYFIPEPFHLIFGGGYWGGAPLHGYVGSDVGYIRLILSFGVFGALLFYALQWYIYYYSYKFYTKEFKFKLGFMFVFFVLFAAELKEEFFVQNYGFKILILLAILAFTKKELFKEITFRK